MAIVWMRDAGQCDGSQNGDEIGDSKYKDLQNAWQIGTL